MSDQRIDQAALPIPELPLEAADALEQPAACTQPVIDPPTPPSDAAVPSTVATAPDRWRKRKVALLLFLSGLTGCLLLFSGWYLLFRKPISQLPLPPITGADVPHYEFSIYGAAKPTGVAVTPSGDRIYVTDPGGSGSVKVFDAKGNALGELKLPGTYSGDHEMIYVAVDPTNGDVYASDRPAGTIWVFGSDGAFRRRFTPDKTLAGWQPLALAFGPDGNLYVTDLGGSFHRVDVLTKSGTLVRSIGQQGQLSFPNGLAFDSQGQIYVADSNDGRLLVFDQAGREVGVIARGVGSGNLGIPRGVAVDDQNVVYVVDMTGQTVQLYHALVPAARSPVFIARFGTEGSSDGAFEYPNGVAVDARARVYVTDQVNDRVQVWSY